MNIDCPDIPGVRLLPVEPGQLLVCEVDGRLKSEDATRFEDWVLASINTQGWVTLTESGNRLTVRRGL